MNKFPINWDRSVNPCNFLTVQHLHSQHSRLDDENRFIRLFLVHAIFFGDGTRCMRSSSLRLRGKKIIHIIALLVLHFTSRKSCLPLLARALSDVQLTSSRHVCFIAAKQKIMIKKERKKKSDEHSSCANEAMRIFAIWCLVFGCVLVCCRFDRVLQDERYTETETETHPEHIQELSLFHKSFFLLSLHYCALRTFRWPLFNCTKLMHTTGKKKAERGRAQQTKNKSKKWRKNENKRKWSHRLDNFNLYLWLCRAKLVYWHSSHTKRASQVNIDCQLITC